MQILGKRSKILLIAVAIVMLVAIGVSFAAWDSMSTVKATNGDISSYANAKVGDIIEFGQYYQTGNKISNAEDAEYEKTPVEWIVVDKDERTGQLTLMSKYILACGSYFGNWYHNGIGHGYHYGTQSSEIANITYNSAYIDSTVRAYLNNLERRDMGGDIFDSVNGYVPSGKDSIVGNALYASIGFSNQKYWTGLSYDNDAVKLLLEDENSGLIRRADKSEEYNKEIYYKRPINSAAYVNRPATKGFYDEAFTENQKSMIVPKTISGYIGHRWPNNAQGMLNTSYVEGCTDKVWIPSVTELNIANGIDWNQEYDSWSNSSDNSSSTVFEYFNNYSSYKNAYADRNNNSVSDAIRAERTVLAQNGAKGNYSIPVYDKGTTTVKTEISTATNYNSSDHYWTRTPSSYWFNRVRFVEGVTARFNATGTDHSYLGVRPCVIIKY